MLPASRLFADVVMLQPGAEGMDALVAQMNGGMNFGSNSALASGQGPDFGGSEKRAFLQFNLSSIPAGATINSATLSLYVSQAAGGAQTASAYKVTSTWDESAVNWNSQPSSDATAVSSVAVNSTGWKSWTMTSLVASWCNGSVTNNGVLVKQSSGSPPNNVQFYSSDYGGDATLRPKLVVDYTSVNNPPTAVSLNAPTNVTDTTISLSWSQNADADFQSYKLYRSTTPGVTEASTLLSTVTSQTSTTYANTGLTATTAYYYRVFVVDTGGLSSGSNETSATTASPPPPPPSVANLSVAATPNSIVADGAAQSTITATLTDVNNQPVADHAVDFTTSSGTLSAASATSNAQGNASVTLTSGTAAGTANIVSTSSGLTGTCSVTFTAPPPPPAPTLTVTANPATLPADGASQCTITATLMDGNNQTIANETINFQTPAGTLSPTAATTNAQGIATVSLTSGTQAATPTITATSTSATGTCSLTFTGGTSSGVTITVAVTPNLITADGQSTATVSATTTDNGQAVPDGTTVPFTTTWGSFQDADPLTPQSLQATTVNGVATVVLVSSGAMPTGMGSYTVTASALGKQIASSQQAQGTSTPPADQKLVIYWSTPTADTSPPCVTNGMKMSGCGVIHLYVVTGTSQCAGVVKFRALETLKPENHVDWYFETEPLPGDIRLVTYTDPAQVPACAPAIQQGQTLNDFYTWVAPGWATEPLHNGDWTVEASYWYNSGPNTKTEFPKETIHVEINNLLLTVSQDATHTTLLQWRGAGNGANKTEVKFNLTCQGRVDISPEVRIYDLTRGTSPDSSGAHAIRTVTLETKTVTATETVWTWPWDGQQETGGAQNTLQPSPPGLYAFDVRANWTGATCGGEDRKSSKCLFIEETSTSVPSFKPWLNETVSFSYRLSSTPDSTTLKLRVYELTTMTCVRTLDTLQATPGVTHTVTWDGKNDSGQPVSPDQYAWFLEGKDTCGDNDRALREKWVLERGGKVSVPLQVRYVQGDPGGVGYVAVPAFTGSVNVTFDVVDPHAIEGEVEVLAADASTVLATNPFTRAAGGATTITQTWNCLATGGLRVEPGTYPVRVTARDAAGHPHASSDNNLTAFFSIDSDYRVDVPTPFIPCQSDPAHTADKDLRFKYSLWVTPAWTALATGGTPFQGVLINVHDSTGFGVVNLGGDLGYWGDATHPNPPTTPLNDLSLDNVYNNIDALIPPDDYGHVVVGFDNWGKNTMPKVGSVRVCTKAIGKLTPINYLPEPGNTAKVNVELRCVLGNQFGHSGHVATNWRHPITVRLDPTDLPGICSNFDESNPALNHAVDFWWDGMPRPASKSDTDPTYTSGRDRLFRNFQETPTPTFSHTGGAFDFDLISYDWGGRVTATVSTGGCAESHIVVPEDFDGDTLPDNWETDPKSNASAINPDTDGDGIPDDRDDDDHGPHYVFCEHPVVTVNPPYTAHIHYETPEGDGFPDFDEYRGFSVKGNIERADCGIKNLFLYGHPNYPETDPPSIGHAGVWGLTVHSANDSEGEWAPSGTLVNYNGARTQNGLRIIYVDGFYGDINFGGNNPTDPDRPTPDDPNDPVCLAKNSVGGNPNASGKIIRVYRGALAFAIANRPNPFRSWSDEFNWAIAHEVGHGMNVRHNDEYPWIITVPSSLMDTVLPFPTLTLNDANLGEVQLNAATINE